MSLNIILLNLPFSLNTQSPHVTPMLHSIMFCCQISCCVIYFHESIMSPCSPSTLTPVPVLLQQPPSFSSGTSKSTSSSKFSSLDVADGKASLGQSSLLAELKTNRHFVSSQTGLQRFTMNRMIWLEARKSLLNQGYSTSCFWLNLLVL